MRREGLKVIVTASARNSRASHLARSTPWASWNSPSLCSPEVVDGSRAERPGRLTRGQRARSEGPGHDVQRLEHLLQLFAVPWEVRFGTAQVFEQESYLPTAEDTSKVSDSGREWVLLPCKGHVLYADLDAGATSAVLGAGAGRRPSAPSGPRTPGDTLGDPLADEIYRALLEEPTRLTRSGIRDLFNRNRSSKDIGHALQSLAATGRVNVERRHERGRPAEIWRDLASTSQLIRS